jgi:hypothetical protein
MALGTLILLAALAQGPSPTCASPQHRALDFWIGEWDVENKAGTKLFGTNHVASEERGCLIHEYWTSKVGATGQSMNFLDDTTRKWVHVWVGEGTMYRFEGNPVASDKLVLFGDNRIPGTDDIVKFEATWSKEPDGRVRKLWRYTKDGGATWTVFLDGWYRRRAAK